MKTLLKTLALLLLMTGTAQAQSRMELARQYVELPAVQQMMRDMFSPETMYLQMKASMPAAAKISNAKKRRIGNVMSQGMMQVLPTFNKVMIRESARAFTKAELKAMVTFYSSPEGASILRKSTGFMNKSLAKIAPQMQAVQKAVTPAIINILKD
ncbi:DUF2059 domain-containing protein [Lentibacter algarum]|uniref:DUF2059 domain-containing protein n=1 Tax=Lentibacter algarum TaxID=576131 RepID=UPI001C099708|nr:DUF2059 domain-containing protein [Lentibacter algarum]MBU2983185.1 DUF2059 domain-containing protein [Lentibacter algarum]